MTERRRRPEFTARESSTREGDFDDVVIFSGHDILNNPGFRVENCSIMGQASYFGFFNTILLRENSPGMGKECTLRHARLLRLTRRTRTRW